MNESKYILRGDPVPDANKLSYTSVGCAYLDRLRSARAKVIFINGDTSEELTGSQILDRSAVLANRLLLSGIKVGDVIGICSENSCEYVYALVAGYLIGAVPTLLNTSYKEDEFAHVIDLSQPKLIFASAQTLDRLVAVTSKRPFVQKLIVFNNNYPVRSRDVITYNEFIGNTRPLESFPCELQTNDQDVAIIFYSSGTTGIPKAVQLTHKNILASMERRRVLPGIKCLNILPWFHVYGYVVFNYNLNYYEDSVFLARFNPELFLNCIQKYKLNALYIVPAVVAFMVKSPLVHKYDITSAKFIYCGGAPLAKHLIPIVKEKFNIAVREGYGMTETTSGIVRQSDVKCKLGSIGGLLYGILGKVIDIETGKVLGPYEHGELCFKGENIMKGYLGNAAETKRIIDDDGWIRTGDIGYYDKDEEWFIVDRIKELIKYKGFQVAPAELETVLMNHAKIVDAAVVGVPDDEAGELPMAFVVLKGGLSATEKEIQNFVAGKVSSPKHLRGGVRFVDAIPRNASSKILRSELKKMIQGVRSKL